MVICNHCQFCTKYDKANVDFQVNFINLFGSLVIKYLMYFHMDIKNTYLSHLNLLCELLCT